MPFHWNAHKRNSRKIILVKQYPGNVQLLLSMTWHSILTDVAPMHDTVGMPRVWISWHICFLILETPSIIFFHTMVTYPLFYGLHEELVDIGIPFLFLVAWQWITAHNIESHMIHAFPRTVFQVDKIYIENVEPPFVFRPNDDGVERQTCVPLPIQWRGDDPVWGKCLVIFLVIFLVIYIRYFPSVLYTHWYIDTGQLSDLLDNTG